jgi:signal transduction histidine kinase
MMHWRYVWLTGVVVIWGALTLAAYDAQQPVVVIQFGSAIAVVWAVMTSGLIIGSLLWLQARYTSPHSHLYDVALYISDAVVFYDRRGRVLWQNELAKQVFASPDALQKTLDQFRRLQTQQQVRMQVITPDKQKRYTAYAVPLDRTYALLVIKPTQTPSPHVYDNFIRRIIHDMRNPLAGIIGHAANLQHAATPEQPDFKHSATTIEHEAQRLARLVDSMLFDARLAYIPLNVDCLDLLDVVEEAFFAYEERAAQDDKQLVINAPPHKLPVEGDRDLLLRAFENLIDNSLKYTNTDALVEINLSADNSTCQLCIKDNGIGISSDYLPTRLFEPMVRGQATGAGSGLGLSIVKKIIEMHHGDIRVESTVNIGTTMFISLPRGGTLCDDS